MKRKTLEKLGNFVSLESGNHEELLLILSKLGNISQFRMEFFVFCVCCITELLVRFEEDKFNHFQIGAFGQENQ